VAHRLRDRGEPLTLAEKGRLGFGEYIPYAGVRVALAREWFLESVRRFAREALVTLSQEPFESYLNSGILSLDLTRVRREYRPFDGEDDPESRSSRDLWDVWEHLGRGEDFHGINLSRLRQSLQVWAETYHLEAGWCIRHALYTLDFWSQSPAGLEQLNWARQPDIIIFGKYEEPTIGGVQWPDPPEGFEHWRPGSEKREDYIKGAEVLIQTLIRTNPCLSHAKGPIRRSFVQSNLKALDRYCDKVDKVCRQLGWVKVSEWPSLKKHIKWAVRFQVKSVGSLAIARSVDPESPNERHTKREIKKVLLLVGLTPDKRRPGRRRGKKDSRTSHRQLLKEPKRSRSKTYPL
jgi:hypothetical protein